MTEILDTGTDELLGTLAEDGVATLTLNRPERRNALSDTLTPALRNMLDVLARDTRVRVLVVTGAGTAFCAGGDIGGMGDGRGDRPPVSRDEAVRELVRRQETLTLRLAHFPRPTIAALPGPAAGAGMSIALSCDVRVMAERAFVTTGFRNVGLAGDYGGTWLLQRLVGPAQAKLLYFTGERVPAERCLALGIAQRVVADDALRADVAALASDIASAPPVALAWMKRNIDRASVGRLDDALRDEAQGTVECAATEDHKEAVRAFMEKRPGVFVGR